MVVYFPEFPQLFYELLHLEVKNYYDFEKEFFFGNVGQFIGLDIAVYCLSSVSYLKSQRSHSIRSDPPP